MGRWLGVALSALTLAGARPVAAHPGARGADARISGRGDEDPSARDWLVRAAARLERGDLQGAADDLDEAASRADVDEAAWWLARAQLERARGDDGGAERASDAALVAARPAGSVPSRAYVEALALRAEVRAARGARADALADLEAAYAARPSAELGLARGALLEAEGAWGDAADGYREALATTGAVAIRHALARALLRAGRADEARAVADEALAGRSLEVDWLLVRAEARAQLGDPEGAAEDRRAARLEAERACARRPSDLRRLALGRALLAEGRREAARSIAEEVMAARPGLAEARALAEAARAAEGHR